MQRLRRWFAKPPPDAPPSEVLRWLRRLAMAVALLGLLGAARQLATGVGTWWVMAAASAALVLAVGFFSVAIRAAERQERLRDPGAG